MFISAARVRTQTYHSRARGYKKPISSSLLILDGGSGGAGLELEEEVAAGLELTGDERTQAADWSWLRTSGPRQWSGAAGPGLHWSWWLDWRTSGPVELVVAAVMGDPPHGA